MTPLFVVLLFGSSLALVVVSSNYFVTFATRLAKRFGVSEFLIGLTLVAVGTSLPELVNTIVASINGVNSLAFGNILGSNMSNTALAVGLCTLLAPIAVKPRYYKRELMVLAVTTVLFAVALSDGFLSRVEGVILLTVFIVYMNFVAKILFDFGRLIDPKELGYFVEYLSRVSFSSTVETVRNSYQKIRRTFDKRTYIAISGMLASLAVLIFASHVLVKQALEIASLLGISSTAVGATLVAIGTTTPELSVSIASARRGYFNLFFGNIIGSNIVNILLIMGIGVLINPFAVSSAIVMWGMALLGLSTAVFCWLLSRKQIIHKGYGVLLLALYGCFLGRMWILA